MFLAMFYLMVNSGLAFNIHYCGGKLANVSTALSEAFCSDEVKTCCSEKKVNNGCCSNETVELDAVGDDLAVINDFSELSVNVILENLSEVTFCGDDIERIESFNGFSYQSNAPPLYKLYCQYTFYG